MREKHNYREDRIKKLLKGVAEELSIKNEQDVIDFVKEIRAERDKNIWKLQIRNSKKNT